MKHNLLVFEVPDDASRMMINAKGQLVFVDGGDGVIKSHNLDGDGEILGCIENGKCDYELGWYALEFRGEQPEDFIRSFNDVDLTKRTVVIELS